MPYTFNYISNTNSTATELKKYEKCLSSQCYDTFCKFIIFM